MNKTVKFWVIVIACIALNACNSNNKPSNTAIIGERIDGPANMRDTVNGKVLFSLNDDVLVETGVPEGQWQQVGRFIKLSNEQADSFYILPNTDLKSLDGEVIGKTIDTVYLTMIQSDDEGFIGAYTHCKNIKPSTVIENVLSAALQNKELDKQALNKLISDFKMQEYDLGELGYTEIYLYESIIEDPSPRDRATLLFDKQSKLVGVIHTRNLNTPSYKTYPLIRGHKLTITSNLPQVEVDSLIARRIRFYNSVD